jgi:hypothetical protein
MYSDETVQGLVFDSDFLSALGRRANAAAAGGARTFQVPELEPVAAAIAADTRVERARAAALRWKSDGASYHDLIRLCAGYVLDLDAVVPACEPVYVPKARGELEPLLALWPHVVALPTVVDLSSRDLLRLRAFPVHPLGVKNASAWADGRQCSPAEFFFHDVDHARFKIREDLLAMGMSLTDPYLNGTTFDPVTGRHRTILAEALGKVGPPYWASTTERTSLIDGMLNRITELTDQLLADAAEWLLFQILHEKSFPLDVPALRRELATRRHVELLRTKVENGFYERNTPSAGVMAQADAARYWLQELLT